MSNELGAEIGVAVAKVTPVAAVAAWGPAEWMYALTAVYVVLQGAYLVWKWWREAKKK